MKAWTRLGPRFKLVVTRPEDGSIVSAQHYARFWSPSSSRDVLSLNQFISTEIPKIFSREHFYSTPTLLALPNLCYTEWLDLPCHYRHSPQISFALSIQLILHAGCNGSNLVPPGFAGPSHIRKFQMAGTFVIPYDMSRPASDR
jgi:hypothetical protein